MKTTDLFKFNRTSKRLNESMFKTFGRKLNLETFNVEQLEDARNKLRTQIYTARSSSSFNETVENDALSQAQFMHDAIVAELSERDEPIVDNTQLEGFGSMEEQLARIMKQFDENMNEIGGYGEPDVDKIVAMLKQGDVEGALDEVYGSYSDQDGGEIRSNDYDNYLEDLEAEFQDLAQGGDEDEGVAEGFASSEQEAKVRARLRQVGDKDPDNVYKIVADEFDMTEDELRAALNDEKNVAEGDAEDYETFDQGEAVQNEAYINSAEDAINLLADIRKQSKIAERGGGEPVRPNQLVNDLWDVMQWIEANMKESIETESVNTGDDMTRLQEGEIQQASAIVTAKTMVDRVGRWIEELSGMENDTLLQLGDSIRDEMGQEQAKGFIEAVAPAIQSALENLKTTREALASGVRTLTGEEQPANMLGGDPAADMAAEPDAMNTDAELGGDEFAAAEPAAGGAEEAGREMRESINHQNRLMRALAG